MYEPKGDPFFEQLKADIQEGIDSADRGELIAEEDVWRELHERIDENRFEEIVYQPKGDPFFEQLKADVQEGIDAADRGKLISAEDVRAHFRERTRQLRSGK